MTLRITPIAPRPVRTVSAIQKRREAEKQAALHERLKREVKEKADACQNDDGLDLSRPASQADVLVSPRMGA